MSYPTDVWSSFIPQNLLTPPNGGGGETVYTDYAAAKAALEAMDPTPRATTRVRLVNKTDSDKHILCLRYDSPLTSAVPEGPMILDNVTDSVYSEVTSPNIGNDVTVADGSKFAIDDEVSFFDVSTGVYTHADVDNVVTNTVTLSTSVTSAVGDVLIKNGVTEIAESGSGQMIEAEAGGYSVFQSGLRCQSPKTMLNFYGANFGAAEWRAVDIISRRFEVINNGTSTDDTRCGLGYYHDNKAKELSAVCRYRLGSWQGTTVRATSILNGNTFLRAFDTSDIIKLALSMGAVTSTTSRYESKFVDVNNLGLGGVVQADPSDPNSNLVSTTWGPFLVINDVQGADDLTCVVKDLELSLV